MAYLDGNICVNFYSDILIGIKFYTNFVEMGFVVPETRELTEKWAAPFPL